MGALAVLSGLLMSVPYLVPHCGAVALVGLVPLLWAEEIAGRERMRRFWVWHYLSFVVWNTLATFWVCNATIGGGIFAILANSLQMSVVFGLFRLARKHFAGILPYIFLATAWIAWERWYMASAQISWPWLVLGNAFARTTSLIQWYEYTGALGGSLWVWASNIGIFLILRAIVSGTWKNLNAKARVCSQAALITVLAAPALWSSSIYRNYNELKDPLEVAILQPNIDPYHKFEFLTQKQQDSILISQIELARTNFASLKPILLLAPETFTSNLEASDPWTSKTLNSLAGELEKWPAASIIFGASSYDLSSSRLSPSKTARAIRDGLWYESHNSALILNPDRQTEIYHKSKLVVGVEMTPYPGLFTRLDDMLGGVMGRCSGQKERTCLTMRTRDGESIAVAPVICYESIYGDFCRGYIDAGARLIAIITNDAWWKDTPGYRQHLSYACLRAIETRRDIVRCGNTGISAFIDQRGDVVSRTPWWQKKILHGHANLNDSRTFFVEHGDITGRISVFCFLLLLAALLARMVCRRKR
ncbi:MAG: apolipoprotein N-acyltransferase [Bacteroidales bacterium]|nr:apolipoprotein N-acyltransferase [Bacteroidales bacterium]